MIPLAIDHWNYFWIKPFAKTVQNVQNVRQIHENELRWQSWVKNTRIHNLNQINALIKKFLFFSSTSGGSKGSECRLGKAQGLGLEARVD